MILSALEVSRTLANPSRGFLRGTPGTHAHDGLKRGDGKLGLIAVDEEHFVTTPVFLDSKTARPSGVLEVGPSPRNPSKICLSG